MFLRKMSNSEVFLASLVGFMAGVAVYAIHEYMSVDNDLTTNGMTVLAFAISGFAGFVLTHRRTNTKTSILFSVALASLIAGLYFLLSSLYGDPIASYNNPTGDILFFTGILISYVGIGFYRAHDAAGWWTDYPALFRQAWNLPVITVLGFCFLGLGLGVFLLWAELFKLIDITFFADLFAKKWFYNPYAYTLIALGGALVRQRESIVEALAAIAILLLRVVSPVIFAFSFAFLISLSIVGLEPLWAATSATTTTTSLILLSAIIISTTVSSGEAGETKAHPVFLWSARGQALLLPAFAGIAVYSLWLRVDQYGWNVDRVLGALVVLFSLALAFTYLLSALMPAWTHNIRRSNIALALFAVLLGGLVQTPLLNPFGISIRSQMDRLERGAVTAENFDYGYLWFKLGRAGAKALENLENDQQRADHNVIVIGIKEAKSRSYYVVPDRNKHIYTRQDIEAAFGDRFLVRPPEGTIDLEFETALLAETDLVQSCMDTKEDRPCLIVSIEIFEGGPSEYIVLRKPIEKRHYYRCMLFYKDRRSETWLNQTCGFDSYSGTNFLEIWNSFERGAYSTFEPNIKGIDINGRPHLLVPQEKNNIYPEMNEAPPSPPQEEAPAP
ncbi:MAG: DUF4153 domain-containing protein [Alphaproteobacteria bacterium]|nr:MAG: DUF4153 domain-containing protein [Alphaproteobacteria bacterium]